MWRRYCIHDNSRDAAIAIVSAATAATATTFATTAPATGSLVVIMRSNTATALFLFVIMLSLWVRLGSP